MIKFCEFCGVMGAYKTYASGEDYTGEFYLCDKCAEEYELYTIEGKTREVFMDNIISTGLPLNGPKSSPFNEREYCKVRNFVYVNVTNGVLIFERLSGGILIAKTFLLPDMDYPKTGWYSAFESGLHLDTTDNVLQRQRFLLLRYCTRILRRRYFVLRKIIRNM